MIIPIGQRRISVSPDALCILALIGLWLLYFWRLLTPNPLNQISLKEGDFSGQFVAYAGYQASRLAQGQIPLWNPFNNSGTPFLADTQSAALYLPRLITLAITNLISGNAPTPGALYNALQLEMAAHVLFASIGMYALLRRLTGSATHDGVAEGTADRAANRTAGTYVAGLIGALTFAYGGYLTGYPPLQLAVLESGVWLPLILIGLHIAIAPGRSSIRWPGISGAGVALGMAFLAGHPQTDLAIVYVSAAYLIFRTWQAGLHWRAGLRALIVFGAIGGGLAAAQLIPGLEFSRLSARSADFSFDSQGNGFPLTDLVQMLFPGWVTLWSPLYFGIGGLGLALLASWARVRESRFWLAAGAIGLALSLGAHTILWDVDYNLLPGFALFRGQERAAFAVAVASAILAGLGAGALIDRRDRLPIRWLPTLILIAVGMSVFTAIAYSHLLITSMNSAAPNTITSPIDSAATVNLIATSTAIAWLFVALIHWRPDRRLWLGLALIGLVAFDLFTFARATTNYDPQPASARLPISPLIAGLQADQRAAPTDVYRVDGTRGLLQNYGSLYAIPDINGISPLRFEPYDRLIGLLDTAPARVWEVLAVRDVLTPNTQLPIPAQIVRTGSDAYGAINVQQIADPRPFAQLIARAWIAPTEDDQLHALANPDIPLRSTVILPADPGIGLPTILPTNASAVVQAYSAEAFSITTHSSTPAILSIAQVDYPGWQATIDGQPTPILRANLALMAIDLPAGDHTIRVTFQPLSVAIGGAISLVTLILLVIALMVRTILPRRKKRTTQA